MIAPTTAALREPAHETVAELQRWRPEHGVLSLYIDADPGDRSGPWRIELRNGLDTAARAAEEADRETRLAVRDTVDRLASELPGEIGQAEARGFFGFVEASRKEPEARWYAAQMAPRRTQAGYGPVSELHLLLALLDEGQPLGAAATSADRVRLLDWRLGRVRELKDWELEMDDLPEDRLEANRERFARQTAKEIAAEVGRNGWLELLLIGDERYARQFEERLSGRCGFRHVDTRDVISQPTGEIERHLESLLPAVSRKREQALIVRIKEDAVSHGRSALGVAATLEALVLGKVDHLVYDAERDYPDVRLELEEVAPGEDPEMPLVERMIELALSTKAKITPVEGESAAMLAEQGGAAALLRY